MKITYIEVIFERLKREWRGWFGALKLGSAIEMARAESCGPINLGLIKMVDVVMRMVTMGAINSSIL